VRGVDVEPDSVLATEGADGLEVVVEAGAGRTGGRHERHRPQPGIACAVERGLEPGGRDALVLVDLERDQRALAEPEHRDAALDRVVRGIGRQHRQRAIDPLRPRVRRGRRARGQQRR